MSFSSILTYFALGYAALTIFFYAMSLVVPQAAFAARALASYISLLIVAAYGVFASIFLTLIGKQGIAQWAVSERRNIKGRKGPPQGLSFGICHSMPRETPCQLLMLRKYY